MVLRFGEFTLDAKAGVLERAGERVRVEPQPARLLALLAERPGELLTREELAERLWGPDVHVDYAECLSYCVRQARLALGDEARRPRFIETLPRRGYRFVAEVRRGDRGRTSRRRRLWAGVAVAAGLVTLVALVEQQPNDHHAMAVRALETLHSAIWGD